MQLEIQQLDNKTKTLIYASTNDCIISRFNTRKNRSDEDIEKLAQRIERNGFEITRALWAYRENGKYEVFAGGNRLEAVKKTSHTDNVPLLLHKGYSDEGISYSIWQMMKRTGEKGLPKDVGFTSRLFVFIIYTPHHQLPMPLPPIRHIATQQNPERLSVVGDFQVNKFVTDNVLSQSFRE